MNSLSIGDIFDQAWQHTKRHGLLLAVVFFVGTIILQSFSLLFLPAGYWDAVTSGNVEALERMNTGFHPSSVITYVISLVLGLAIFVTILRLMRGTGGNFDLSSFKLPLSTYLKYLGVCLLLVLAVGLGLVLLVVPGIYLAVRLYFAPLYILDHPEASIEDAFKFTWRATDGKFFTLLGLGVVSLVVTLAGLLLCCVGVFYTGIIGYFAFAVTYQILLDEQNSSSAFGAQTPNAW
ncbi:MAG: hypothetical protein HUK09_05330 [Bacteroidaceae bacterium]|nr:hypothetical protein [Bacteroidaceae bacterium]